MATAMAVTIRVLCTTSLFAVVLSNSVERSPRTTIGNGRTRYANVTGELLLGGLFPVHRKGNNGKSCGEIQVRYEGENRGPPGVTRFERLFAGGRRRSTVGSDAVHDRTYQRESADTSGRATRRVGVRHLRSPDLRSGASVLLREG